MALSVTSLLKSVPLVAYYYDIEGLVNGSNLITLPLPTLQGSFPPDGQWTPTEIWCFPYQSGSLGNSVTPDLASIVQTNGTVTFNLWAGGATNARVLVW